MSRFQPGFTTRRRSFLAPSHATHTLTVQPATVPCQPGRVRRHRADVPTPRPTPADQTAFALRRAVRAERSRLGWNQQQLADRLGMTRRSISDLELGERTIAASELPDICEALGVSLADLLRDVPEARGKLGI